VLLLLSIFDDAGSDIEIEISEDALHRVRFISQQDSCLDYIVFNLIISHNWVNLTCLPSFSNFEPRMKGMHEDRQSVGSTLLPSNVNSILATLPDVSDLSARTHGSKKRKFDEQADLQDLDLEDVTDFQESWNQQIMDSEEEGEIENEQDQFKRLRDELRDELATKSVYTYVS
jgi:hypothetical protein